MVPLIGRIRECISQWRTAYYSRVMPKYQLILKNRDKKFEKYVRFDRFFDAKNTLNLTYPDAISLIISVHTFEGRTLLKSVRNNAKSSNMVMHILSLSRITGVAGGMLSVHV